ncbi:hypothetical protein GCM10010094_70380 [Streptomyces flaveus]|uniref:SCO1431 family membrane protein n=1 Tax=Streptomyces flaveus TaxID=66370 RepID=A0A917VNS8_9ACTN|nr:hypothetical protein GCM10010094_70380 [Streptomyces flaveus]
MASGESTDRSQRERAAMTATSVTAGRLQTRTGGPKDDDPKILEHLAGWTLVVVLAMLVTQLGVI